MALMGVHKIIPTEQDYKLSSMYSSEDRRARWTGKHIAFKLNDWALSYGH